MASKNNPIRVSEDFKKIVDGLSRDLEVTSAQATKFIANVLKKGKFK